MMMRRWTSSRARTRRYPEPFYSNPTTPPAHAPSARRRTCSTHATSCAREARVASARHAAVAVLRPQLHDQLVVAARRGVVERGVAVVVAGVDVGAELFDQVLDRGEPRVRSVAMGVAGEPLAVLDAGGGVNRRRAGPAVGHRRRLEALLLRGRRRRDRSARAGN